MRWGTLEVMLVEGYALANTEIIGKSDPYAIITCRTQDMRSSTAVGGGENPKWNEIFVFSVDENVQELTVKIFDQDNFKVDDAIGTSVITLGKVFEDGHVLPLSYKVHRSSGEVHGEIKVGLKFIPEKSHH